MWNRGRDDRSYNGLWFCRSDGTRRDDFWLSWERWYPPRWFGMWNAAVMTAPTMVCGFVGATVPVAMDLWLSWERWYPSRWICGYRGSGGTRRDDLGCGIVAETAAPTTGLLLVLLVGAVVPAAMVWDVESRP